MNNALSGFETDLLNKYIHTQTFDELSDVQIALNESLNEQKNSLISSGQSNDDGFNSFVTRTVGNISDFLVDNGFFHAREGGVYFLTERGKHLKLQGSLQKYMDWEKIRDQELVDEMHTIQSKGYLEREQPRRAELAPQPMDEEKRSNLVYYILIIAAVIVFYLIGKYHKFN